MSIDSGDIKWLAGLLEGEGCFTTAKTHHYPIISLNMTDRDVVERAAALMKQPHIYRKEKENPKHRPTFYFALTGPRAAGWMMTLHSLMGRRRKAAIEAMLKLYRAVPRAPQLRTHCGNGHALQPYPWKAPRSRPRYCPVCYKKSTRAAARRYRARKLVAAEA